MMRACVHGAKGGPEWLQGVPNYTCSRPDVNVMWRTEYYDICIVVQ